MPSNLVMMGRVIATALALYCGLWDCCGQDSPATSKPEIVAEPGNLRINLGRPWPTVKRSGVESALLAKLDQMKGQSIYSCAHLEPTVQIHKGQLYFGPAPVSLPALQPILIEGVYVVGRPAPGVASISAPPPAGLTDFVVVLHLSSDQYAGVQVTASPERLRATTDPLNELLGADSQVFVNPANFPFSEREIEAIVTHRFEVGDSDGVVRCSLGGRKFSTGQDAAGREIRTYDNVSLTMDDGRVFAVRYFSKPKPH